MNKQNLKVLIRLLLLILKFKIGLNDESNIVLIDKSFNFRHFKGFGKMRRRL
jgi:hypothetical protein